MASIEGWEREFKKPVVTTNQAALWAMRQRLGSSDRMPGLGRLLDASGGLAARYAPHPPQLRVG